MEGAGTISAPDKATPPTPSSPPPATTSGVSSAGCSSCCAKSSSSSSFDFSSSQAEIRFLHGRLIKPGKHGPDHCPVCESQLAEATPLVAEIERSLKDLSEQLDAVQAENPRLQVRLASLLREEALLQERLRDNQQRIANRMQENEILRVQQENFIL